MSPRAFHRKDGTPANEPFSDAPALTVTVTAGQDIPAMGVEQTYKLQRRARDQGGKERPARAEKDRGVVQLALRFHNVRGAAQREQHVVRHERLQLAVVGAARRQFDGEPFTWRAEQVPPAGRALLTQHAAWGNLSRAELLVAAWSAYAEVHCAAPLDYKFLFTQLQNIKQCLQEGDVTARDVSDIRGGGRKGERSKQRLTGSIYAQELVGAGKPSIAQ